MSTDRVIPIMGEEPDPESALASAQAQLLRALADCDNLRKRLGRDVARRVEEERVAFVEALLPVMDSLDQALAADDAPEGGWRQGLEQMAAQMCVATSRLGIERLDPLGDPFDPAWHEAAGTVPAGSFPPGHVAQVLRPGYRLGERLVRPARVLVAG